jgi:hypothetical protein
MGDGLDFKKLAANGILGLAFEGISQLGAKPVVQTLVDEHRLDHSVFGLSLAGSEPVLAVGGSDSSRYKGKLTCLAIRTPAVRISRDVPCLHFNGHDTGSLAD